MEKKIIEELFEKRMETTEKINKELDRKLSKLAISQKEDEIVQLFKKETSEELCRQLKDLFFYYCNAKEKESTLFNEYYYKLGFTDAMKLKKEIKDIKWKE